MWADKKKYYESFRIFTKPAEGQSVATEWYVRRAANNNYTAVLF
jgi:hypothetical protein